MEYKLTEDAQIQASFAHRIGQIFLQYENYQTSLPIEEKFEATLVIALLHSMMAHCAELIKERKPEKMQIGLDDLIRLANRELNNSPSLLGLTTDCIIERWPSTKAATYRDALQCIRNALSHPLPQNQNRYARTGYTSENNQQNQINAFIFTHSPWVGPKGNLNPRFKLANENNKTAVEEMKNEINKWARDNNVINIEYTSINGFLTPTIDGKEFIPVFRICINVHGLRLLLLGLSDYLSEPLQLFEKKAVMSL